MCLHGYKVAIKGKTLKRRTQLLKHSRFLRNMEVYPIFPKEPEPVAEENNEDGEGDVEEAPEDY